MIIMTTTFPILVWCVTIAVTAGKPTVDEFPIVTLEQGTAQGIYEGNVATWRGLPFAAPPVDVLRWQPPQPPAKWMGTLNASSNKAKCVQSSMSNGGVEGSEDCLYLAVYAPMEFKSLQNIPVLIWVHGGGYEAGSANDFDASPLVSYLAKRAIVVCTNYRLNIFGFLGGDTLRGKDGSTGNYGIQDQRAAFTWVHQNVAAFGGDASRVMIFGESAGAGSMSNHMTMPKSNGLFSAVALESGSFPLWVAQPWNYSQDIFNQVATQVKCADVACLHSKTTLELVQAVNKIPAGRCCSNLVGKPYIPWAPTVDGVELTAHPIQLLNQGKINKLRGVLHGTNLDEGSMFESASKTINQSELNTMWTQWYGDVLGSDVATKMRALYVDGRSYPTTEGYSQAWWAAEQSLTDQSFACGARSTSRQLAKLGVPVYQYLFERAWANAPVFHSAELAYVFMNVKGRTPADVTLAQTMASAWASMAASGSPAISNWEKYDDTRDGPFIKFDIGALNTSTMFHKNECYLIDVWINSYLPHT